MSNTKEEIKKDVKTAVKKTEEAAHKVGDKTKQAAEKVKEKAKDVAHDIKKK